MTAYQLTTTTYGDGSNRKLPVEGLITYLFTGDDIIDTDEDLSRLVPLSLITLTVAQVASAGGADLIVTPQADAAAAIENKLKEVASDAAVAITYAINSIFLVDSTSGTKVITTTSANPGQQIDIRLDALGGASEYTLVVEGGTLTFNAASEYARVVRNSADDNWKVLLLSGATVV